MRRLTVFLAVLALLSATSCSKDADVQIGSRSSAPATTTTAATSDAGALGGEVGDAGPTTASPPVAKPPSTTARPSAGGAAVGGAAATSTTRGAAPTATTSAGADPAVGADDLAPPATADGSQGPPGAFARTILRPQPATSVILERFVQEGADVAASSLSHSGRVIGEVSGKPVDVRPPLVLAGGARDWTADDLRATADRVARTPQGGGRAVVRLLLVHGTFEGSDGVLGVAVRGDVLAIFRDSIAAASTPLLSGRSIEDAVLMHEFGHILGLVDIALDTKRGDPEHPGHSRSRQSVMYWAVESSLVGQVLDGGPPRDFDAADLGDLRALRGGG